MLSWVPITLHVQLHRAEVNCTPWSEVMLAGMPNLHIQLWIRASGQATVSTLTDGTASSILLDLSIMVNRKQNPSMETGSGPTMSTWIWGKCRQGTRMGCKGAATAWSP